MSTEMHHVFGALADPTRLAIVERLLREGEKSAGDLAEPFSMSKPAISRHIKVLEESGLIEKRIERQFRMCKINPDAIDELSNWIKKQREFWNSSFDRLDEILETKDNDNG
jgi:DNA-binding transcriptional ArsR family regulator